VAASANGIEGEDRNYDRLIRYITTKGIPLEEVSIGFFPDGIFQ
jgi:hypothetical protein